MSNRNYSPEFRKFVVRAMKDTDGVFTRGCRLVIVDEYGYAPSHVQAKKWYDGELRGEIDHGQNARKASIFDAPDNGSELVNGETSEGLESFADLLKSKPGSASYREVVQGLIEWIVTHGIKPSEFKRLNERGKYHVLTALLGELNRINKQALPPGGPQHIHLYVNGKPLSEQRNGGTVTVDGVTLQAPANQRLIRSWPDHAGELDDGDEPGSLERLVEIDGDDLPENSMATGSDISYDNMHYRADIETNGSGTPSAKELAMPGLSADQRTAAAVEYSLDHTPGAFHSDSDDLPIDQRPPHRLPASWRLS